MPKQLSKKDIKEVFVETLEPFAKAVQTDFNKVNNRLNGIDGRLDGIENRLDGVEHRLDGVERCLDQVEIDIKEMRENSNALFSKLDEFISLYKKHDQELTILSAQVRRLEERIVKLEAKKVSRSKK
ncbi:hypothetical protein M1513_01680 [Patescibacteria group bacterium]|nr:hypothetical protein [Patescibacteria group bacterium]MCL5733321.1 hypothetical protein [Patescibacteria group bacterium]